mgnify:FL=1
MNLSAPYRGIQWTIANSGQISFYLNNTWSTNVLGVRTTATVNDGAWHHVAVTYDGNSSASGVQIYIDGSSVALTILYNTLSATILNSENFTLGKYNSGTGASNAYGGLMDEVAVYNRALTPAEITDIYTHTQ